MSPLNSDNEYNTLSPLNADNADNNSSPLNADNAYKNSSPRNADNNYEHSTHLKVLPQKLQKHPEPQNSISTEMFHYIKCGK